MVPSKQLIPPLWMTSHPWVPAPPSGLSKRKPHLPSLRGPFKCMKTATPGPWVTRFPFQAKQFSVLPCAPHHSWFLWHMRGITPGQPYISHCLLLYGWARATASIKGSRLLPVAWSQTEAHPMKAGRRASKGRCQRQRDWEKVRRQVLVRVRARVWAAWGGGGSGPGRGLCRSFENRMAQPLGHRQLWEGLSLDKKFQRGITSWAEVMNPNQRDTHLSYEKSPLEIVADPRRGHIWRDWGF